MIVPVTVLPTSCRSGFCSAGSSLYTPLLSCLFDIYFIWSNNITISLAKYYKHVWIIRCISSLKVANKNITTWKWTCTHVYRHVSLQLYCTAMLIGWTTKSRHDPMIALCSSFISQVFSVNTVFKCQTRSTVFNFLTVSFPPFLMRLAKRLQCEYVGMVAQFLVTAPISVADSEIDR